MIKCYRRRTRTYNNKILVSEKISEIFLCEESEQPVNKSVVLNWDNISDFYRFNGVGCGFNLWTTKKGKIVSFFNYNIFKRETWDIKEWKSKLNLLITWEYGELNPSIDYILKYHDSDMAIKYLKERNLLC